MLTGINEYGRLRRVAMRRPADAMIDQKTIDREWRDLNYHTAPDFKRAVAEHAAFADIIASVGAELLYLPPDDALTMDSLYVRDAAMVCPRGVILCNMGKPARKGEPAIHGRAFEQAGIPVIGKITGDGQVEGGDLIWLDEKTVAIGRTYRTNAEGIRQFKDIVGPGVHVEVAVMPHYKGPSDVFHLMSVISPLGPRPAAGLFAADADPVPRMAGGQGHAAGRGAGRGIRRHGLQRPHHRAARGGDGEGQSGNPAPHGSGGVQGARDRGERDLGAGRGRADLPDAAADAGSSRASDSMMSCRATTVSQLVGA